MSEMVSAERAREMERAARHGAAVMRDHMRATGDEDRAEEYRAHAEDLDGAAMLARTVVALHAIIEGRTEPPTPAELAAHDRAGGRWIVLRAGRIELPVDGYDARMTTPFPSRWWSLASDGRPCAGPVVDR